MICKVSLFREAVLTCRQSQEQHQSSIQLHRGGGVIVYRSRTGASLSAQLLHLKLGHLHFLTKPCPD